MAASDRPEIHTYKVTYTVVQDETRVQDIEASSIEFFETGNFILTFTEDPRTSG